MNAKKKARNPALYFQLAIIMLRLASDSISAYDVFQAHKEGFTRLANEALIGVPQLAELEEHARKLS